MSKHQIHSKFIQNSEASTSASTRGCRSPVEQSSTDHSCDGCRPTPEPKNRPRTLSADTTPWYPRHYVMPKSKKTNRVQARRPAQLYTTEESCQNGNNVNAAGHISKLDPSVHPPGYFKSKFQNTPRIEGGYPRSLRDRGVLRPEQVTSLKTSLT